MFRWIAIATLAAAVTAPLGHYLVFGPQRLGAAKRAPRVRRFSLLERFVHGLTLVSFVTLAVTGFWAAIMFEGPLHGWWWLVHAGAAVPFAGSVAAMTLLWAADCGFATYDWAWIRRLGGYFGGSQPVPAGRFNAGQKAYFWAVVLLAVATLLSGLARIAPLFDETVQAWAYHVHRYGALLFTASVVVHLYLGTFANPGTFRAMVLGTVAAAWAAHHHSEWLGCAGRVATCDAEPAESGTHIERRSL